MPQSKMLLIHFQVQQSLTVVFTEINLVYVVGICYTSILGAWGTLNPRIVHIFIC